MTEIRPELQTVIDKIFSLKKLTKETGFPTSRSQSELLKRLTADDLALVAAIVYGK